MSEWKDIKTAPRDGQVIRGKNKKGEEADIFFKVSEYLEFWVTEIKEEKNWTRHLMFYPIHWKPLPQPPKEQDNEQNSSKEIFRKQQDYLR